MDSCFTTLPLERIGLVRIEQFLRVQGKILRQTMPSKWLQPHLPTAWLHIPELLPFLQLNISLLKVLWLITQSSSLQHSDRPVDAPWGKGNLVTELASYSTDNNHLRPCLRAKAIRDVQYLPPNTQVGRGCAACLTYGSFMGTSVCTFWAKLQEGESNDSNCSLLFQLKSLLIALIKISILMIFIECSKEFSIIPSYTLSHLKFTTNQSDFMGRGIMVEVDYVDLFKGMSLRGVSDFSTMPPSKT